MFTVSRVPVSSFSTLRIRILSFESQLVETSRLSEALLLDICSAFSDVWSTFSNSIQTFHAERAGPYLDVITECHHPSRCVTYRFYIFSVNCPPFCKPMPSVRVGERFEEISVVYTPCPVVESEVIRVRLPRVVVVFDVVCLHLLLSVIIIR